MRLLRLALNDNFSESRSLIVLYALDHPIHRGIYRAPLTSGESPISVIIKLQDSNFIFMTFNDEELCIVKWWVEIKNESELDSWKLQIDQRLTKNSYIIGKSLPKFPKISPNFHPHFTQFSILTLILPRLSPRLVNLVKRAYWYDMGNLEF